MASLREGSSPIAARLTKRPLGVTASILHDDDSTEPLELTALTLLGAKREASAKLSKLGYEPAGRWSAGMRVFRHSRD